MRAAFKRSWYWLLAAAVILGELAVFLYYGENSYIAVHDNLDLFVPQLRMLEQNGSFFTHGDLMPMLGGVSRDKFGSELCLYNLLYYVLPPFWAYIAGYFLKVLLAMGSFFLLAKELFGKKERQYRPLTVLCGLSYGLAPVFPAYGLAFATIPLIAYLLVKIYKKPAWWLYAAVFVYPFFSYFSYFGIFILGYLVLAILLLWMRDKKLPVRLIPALFALAAGYVVFEYRLFSDMLLGTEVSMRSVMVDTDLDFAGILATVWDVFKNGIFHAQASHTRFLLPVCAAFLVWNNLGYLRKRNWKGLCTDGVNLTVLFLLFNSLVYGMYYWGGLRRTFEALVPPLKGFQYSRTVFFNPFLWYAVLFLMGKKLYEGGRKWGTCLANVMTVVALATVIATPAVYNDFYETCRLQGYQLVKDQQVENLNFREFYSTELFEEIKEEIGYDGEYAVAYGMHPAVLQYNGIHTLDGYLGFYSLEYKENFRKVIAPALDRVEEWRIYFDEWGARAYIFSGDGTNTWNPVRTMTVEDPRLYMDGAAFRNLGGRYLFSRVAISNAEELGFALQGVFEHEDSPYMIYLYRNV